MRSSTEIADPLMQELVWNFYKGNLNFSFKLDDSSKMDWDWQQSFLDATVSSKLIKQFPMSNEFCKLFLKKIIDYLEPSQDIHDGLYTQLCTAMKTTSEDGFCYRHYVIGKNLENVVTVKETRNMVVNGTTGLKTWEAALMLSDWALCNKDIFDNKHILELGSGVGFAGVTIGKMCDVKSLLLTDCHETVLKTISENIRINFSNFVKEEDDIRHITLYKNEPKSMGVMMLDWNSFEHLSETIVPDIIIGADIVYDPTILQPLCNVIQTFFNKNRYLDVYIASVIRNEETFNCFLKTLDALNFICEKIEIMNSVFIEWDEKVQKCLLKIKLKH